MDSRADDRTLWMALHNRLVPLDAQTGETGAPENYSNGNNLQQIEVSPDGRRILASEAYQWLLLRDELGQRHNLLHLRIDNFEWLPDSHRFLTAEGQVFGFDIDRKRRLGTLTPATSTGLWFCVGSTGHVKGGKIDDPASQDPARFHVSLLDDVLLYVAVHDDGSQRSYSPSDFVKKFGWKNDPTQATLVE